MSAQIADQLVYNGQSYSIIATTDVSFLFNPRSFGLNPMRQTTACWRGFWLEYTASEDKALVLDKLYIYCGKDAEYPTINGKSLAKKEESTHSREWGFFKYGGLDIVTNEYTGRILTGRDFILKYGKHMGLQPYYAYKDVKEFVFKDGVLIAVNDRSELTQNVRDVWEQVICNNDDAWLHRRSGRFSTSYFKQLELPKEELHQKYWWVKLLY